VRIGDDVCVGEEGGETSLDRGGQHLNRLRYVQV
jgi:hypothetical protein